MLKKRKKKGGAAFKQKKGSNIGSCPKESMLKKKGVGLHLKNKKTKKREQHRVLSTSTCGACWELFLSLDSQP
jgi:hypothetical protein